MNRDDPEDGIAESRESAGAGPRPVDEHVRSDMEALLGTLRAGPGAVDPGADFMRAAAGSGLSSAQINEALQRFRATIHTGQPAVDPAQDDPRSASGLGE